MSDMIQEYLDYCEGKIPAGLYGAPTVDYNDAALTVARLVAERDAARNGMVNLQEVMDDMERDIKALTLTIKFLRAELYKSQAEIQSLRTDPPKVKWAVRDNVDGCWLGDNHGMPVFTLGKEKRGFFDSKEEALAQYKAYMKYWYAQEEWSKPVFVKVRCK